MARAIYGSTELTAPNWLGGFRVGADAVGTVSPFGALVKQSLFTADENGRKFIQSGTLLGRRNQSSDFEPVAAAMTTTLATTLTAATTALTETVSVESTSGYAVGDIVTIGLKADLVVESVDHQNSTITFTAAVANINAIGAAVALTTAVAQTDFFLLLESIRDASENAEASLARHEAQVKVEFLPGWADLATELKTKIQELYQTYTVTSR